MGNTTLKKYLGDLKACLPFLKYILSKFHKWDTMTKLLRKCHFLSETLVIAIESGDLFSYFWPSKTQVPCYKFNSDVSINDREFIDHPKRRRYIEYDSTIGIIGTTHYIKKKIPPTAVSTQGNDVSNVMTSLSQLKNCPFTCNLKPQLSKTDFTMVTASVQ